MNKAADAFRTISEVADELDVPKHVLRFWENRFPQIKPMKRGGGRRYYRPADLDLLRGIMHLLHNEGYTIKGVQKILREHGVEAVKSTWQPGGANPAMPIPAAKLAAGPKSKAAAKSALSATSPRDRQKLIAGVIRELEACRKLLAGPPAATAVRASRARAGSR